jgi:diguanylate cyclase (GGDEF)-like protein
MPGQWEIQDEASLDSAWLEGRTTRLTDKRGQPGGELVVVRNINARRLSEEAALAARQRAEALYAITQAIASRLDFLDFLDIATRQLERFLPVDFMVAASYFSEGDEWRSERFLNPHGLTETAVRGLHARLLRAAAEARRPLLFNSRVEIQSEFGIGCEVQGQPLTVLMAAPMFSATEINGALLLYSTRGDRSFTSDQFSFFASVASLAAIALANQGLSKRLDELVTRDPLTGLYNSRHFFDLAELEVERALRYRSPLAALVIDLDHFKQINEIYGRAAGDKVLYAVGQTLLHTMRKVDIISRFGGEEFALLLPETGLDNASEAAARLCRLIASLEVQHKGQTISVSASLGLVVLEYGLTVDTLLERANQAVLAAKRAGRNRVSIYEGRSPAS